MSKIQLNENLDLELAVGLTPQKILEELNNYFPDKAPQRNESYEDLMYRAGQRSVVEWLKDRIDEEDFELS